MKDVLDVFEVCDVILICTMHERSYQRLIVWKEAHALCLLAYEFVKKFPSEERFGLMSQMRRSSYSVPMNIAEGSTKKSHKERERFYETAACSLEELHYQCILAKDLKYLAGGQFDQVHDHIQRVSFLLMKLRRALHI